MVVFYTRIRLIAGTTTTPADQGSMPFCLPSTALMKKRWPFWMMEIEPFPLCGFLNIHSSAISLLN